MLLGYPTGATNIFWRADSVQMAAIIQAQRAAVQRVEVPEVSFDFALESQAVVLTPAALSISSGANLVTLSWPNDSIFTLFVATDLTPPVQWTPVATPPVLSNRLWHVALPTSAGATRFYRLQIP